MPDALVRTFEQFGGNRRIILGLLGAGTLGVMWALAQWAMTPAMVPVFSGLPLEDVAGLTQRLEEEGIAHRLDRGGTAISVAEADLAQARVALAQEGYPAGGQPGWELFDQAAWGMTDFTQRVNYRRALEGELERTIGAMRGVENAQVHLAIQKTSVLRQNGPAAEASVVVSLRSGARPEQAMVEGIASLVAGSVDGMEKGQVTVLDNSGRLLSSDDSEFDAEGLTTRQLAIQKEIEGYLEDKAYELVEPVVGAGNITVRVAAALNFDQMGRTVETFDLDNQATVSEDRSEIIPGTEDQGASSITVNSVFETPRSIETFNRSGAQLERLTVAVVVSDREVGEGEAVTYQPRTAQELARVESLVRNALGVVDDRGDAITVVSLPFDRPEPVAEPVEEGMDVVALVMAGIRPGIGLLGLIMAFVLALRLMNSIKTAPMPPARPASLPASGQGEPAYAEMAAVPAAARAMPAPKGPPIELTDPNITAKVVRAWMKEE
jgi:flagellar M-ring protein FliF